MDVCLLWVLCVVRYRSLQWAGPSSRGVLSNVVCLKSVIVKPRKMRRPRPPRGCRVIGGGECHNKLISLESFYYQYPIYL
jgi:hypothetical protein